MRTRILLSMAAVAAGVATSNVYANSYNITFPIGYSFQSNPLDASPDNYANHVIPNVGSGGGSYTGPLDSSSLQMWTGVGWDVVYFDSEITDTTTGFVNGAVLPVPAPLLGPSGTMGNPGYLIENEQGVAVTVTYTGTVRPASSPLYPVAARPYAVGSEHPLAGGVSTALLLKNPNLDVPPQSGQYAGPLDGDAVEFLKVNSLGQFVGYAVSYFDSETSDTTTGFVNAAVVPVPEPLVPIGGGFFLLQDSSAGTYTWVQP